MPHTELCSHTAEQLAELTGAHVSTARRWKRGLPIPEPARRLLRVLTRGELSLLSPAWRGWRISARGELVSPENWTFTPGEVRVSRVLEQHMPRAPQGPQAPPPPPPGSCFDWIKGTWTYAPTPPPDERPLWREVMAAARAQRSAYPKLRR